MVVHQPVGRARRHVARVRIGRHAVERVEEAHQEARDGLFDGGGRGGGGDDADEQAEHLVG